MMRKLAFVALVVVAAVALRAQNATVNAPYFDVDPFWPKPLPNHWVLGSTIGVAVDEQDHIWIIHRPGTVDDNFKAAAVTPQVGRCCTPAPPVLEFDQAGNLVNHWGGPDPKGRYEWPVSNHGITVDHKGNVWIGGNDEAKDTQVLKFTKKGDFLLQIGKQGVHNGSNDTANLWRAAKIFVDPMANEAYIADGYGNRRVIVFDADTGKYKRHWGAYGAKPDDANIGDYDPAAPPAKQFRTVHCAIVSKDRFVYVCDRVNDRVQVFRTDGTFVKEAFFETEDHPLRLGVGHGVLARPAGDLHLPGGRRERGSARAAPRHARGGHHVWRWRPSARAVLRRPQRRPRLEGESLHHRDL
jgi:hypothetical protein